MRNPPWRSNSTAPTGPDSTAAHQSAVDDQPPTPPSRKFLHLIKFMTPHRCKAGLEVVGILFAIIYAVVTFAQWQDLRYNFQIEQRALIGVLIGAQTETNRVLLPNLKYLSIKVRARNIGKVPARAVKIDCQTRVFRIYRANEPSFPGEHRKYEDTIIFPEALDPNPDPIDLPSVTTSLWPTNGPPHPHEFACITATFSGSEEPRGPNRDELADLNAGKAYVATFGRITYADNFADHWTNFCYYITFRPLDGRIVQWCTLKNVTDAKPQARRAHLSAGL